MPKVIDEIIEANKWRDHDFAKFRANQAQVEEALWCRMCVPMLYAHWEGYVVSSLKILIDYLNKLELEPGNVQTHFLVLSLGDSFKSLSGKQSFSQRNEFTCRFIGLLKAKIIFEKNVETKSNLRGDVLKEICDIYGFDYKKFDEVIPDINRLVNIRNKIAHGENGFSVDHKNINGYIDVIIKALDLFLEELEDFVEKEKYLLAR